MPLIVNAENRLVKPRIQYSQYRKNKEYRDCKSHEKKLIDWELVIDSSLRAEPVFVLSSMKLVHMHFCHSYARKAKIDYTGCDELLAQPHCIQGTATFYSFFFFFFTILLQMHFNNWEISKHSMWRLQY